MCVDHWLKCSVILPMAFFGRHTVAESGGDLCPPHKSVECLITVLVNFINLCCIARAPALLLVPVYHIPRGTKKFALTYVESEVLSTMQLRSSELPGLEFAECTFTLDHSSFYFVQWHL